MFGGLEIEGRTLTAAEIPGGLGGGWVSAGYFETLQIPIREGRGFLADEERKDSHVVVVNDTMARRFWPGEPAAGKRLRLGPKSPWLTVVGVVGAVKGSHDETGGLQLYYPVSDGEVFPDTALLVATTSDPRETVAAIKTRAWALDPKLPLKNIETMETLVAATLARPRFNLVLLSVFAGIGLLLAAIGIYGVVSYSVGMRTREIGVRMALGATAADIRRAVLGEAMAMAGIGSLLGIGGALALGRLPIHEVARLRGLSRRPADAGRRRGDSVGIGAAGGVVARAESDGRGPDGRSPRGLIAGYFLSSACRSAVQWDRSSSTCAFVRVRPPLSSCIFSSASMAAT